MPIETYKISQCYALGYLCSLFREPLKAGRLMGEEDCQTDELAFSALLSKKL